MIWIFFWILELRSCPQFPFFLKKKRDLHLRKGLLNVFLRPGFPKPLSFALRVMVAPFLALRKHCFGDFFLLVFLASETKTLVVLLHLLRTLHLLVVE